MDIQVFFFIFIALVVLSTYLTSVINVEFHVPTEILDKPNVITIESIDIIED